MSLKNIQHAFKGCVIQNQGGVAFRDIRLNERKYNNLNCGACNSPILCSRGQRCLQSPSVAIIIKQWILDTKKPVSWPSSKTITK